MRPQQSSNKTFWIVAIVMCVGVAFWALSPSDSGSTSTTKKPVRKTSTTTSSTEADIQPQDYKVKFTPMVAPTNDVFKPIVYHKNAAGGAAANQPNAIPPEYAGGESDWVFTGTAEINNVSEANFQNDKLGQFAQVERGQRWKTSTVTQISADYVMLASTNGNSKKVMMPADVVTEAPKTTVNPANAMVAPVNPAISGPIGADTTSTDTNATDSGANMQQQFGGGMGRGRRGRGGGGRRGGGGFGFGG